MDESVSFSNLSFIERVNLALEWRRNNIYYQVIADKLKLARKTVMK